jgi:hypothetical protein
MPTNRRKTPRKQRRPRQRHGFPVAPERASSSERGKPFPKGNKLGLPTQFKAGASGNPGGVPKSVLEFRELMQMRTEAAISRLDDVLEHGTEEGVIKASREVLANAWGRPPQAIEVGGPGGGPVRVTYDDVRTKLTDLAKKAEERKAHEAEAAAEDAGADAADDDSTDSD